MISSFVSFMPSFPRRPINGSLDSFCDDAITGVELLPLQVHIVTKYSGIYGSCDFGCTGSFCSVADHTGYDRECVDNSMDYFFISTAAQVCDSGSGSGSGADSSAVSREAPDSGFLVDCDQIGKCQCAVSLIFVSV